MTENQRDYLADLAGQKGVRLHDTDNWSVSKASEEIEALKEMPDAVFDEFNDEMVATTAEMTESVLYNLSKWGFTRRSK